MLHLARRLGFSRRAAPQDPGVIEARLELGSEAG